MGWVEREVGGGNAQIANKLFCSVWEGKGKAGEEGKGQFGLTTGNEKKPAGFQVRSGLVERRDPSSVPKYIHSHIHCVSYIQGTHMLSLS